MDSIRNFRRAVTVVGILGSIGGCVSAYVPPPLPLDHPANSEAAEGTKPYVSLRDRVLEDDSLDEQNLAKQDNSAGHAHHDMNHSLH